MNCLSELRKISQQVIEEQGWSEKQVKNILDYKKEIKPKNTLTKEEIMEAKADLLYDDNTFLEEYFLGELDEISKNTIKEKGVLTGEDGMIKLDSNNPDHVDWWEDDEQEYKIADSKNVKKTIDKCNKKYKKTLDKLSEE